MRHGYAGRKLKRTASHRKAMLSNMASSLFEHKRVVTTLAKAKELRSFAEQLITRARHAYSAERAGTANGIDVHNRRMVGRFIRNKAVLQELFDTIAPMVAERNGGYTRITKLGQRRGDQAPEAIIELVDWSNPVDGRVSSRTRKPKTVKAAKPATAKAITEAVGTAPAAEAAAAPVAAEVAEVVDVAETTAVAETTEAMSDDVVSTEESGGDEASSNTDEEESTENA